MKTFEETVTGKLLVIAEGEYINGTLSWPVWTIEGLCNPPERRPIQENGRDHYNAALVVLRCLSDGRIDFKTAHDFRSDGYLFTDLAAAEAYAARCKAEDDAENATPDSGVDE